jgi:hypothetical protein
MKHSQSHSWLAQVNHKIDFVNFLPEDQWKQRRVDEQRDHIVAEIQRKKNKELLESLARLNRRMNDQK